MSPSNTGDADSDLAYLMRFMPSLHKDQEQLRTIQGVYDNLTLLGQLLCAGTDITVMRNDFNNLATVLLNQLAQELRRKAVLSLASQARVAINVLIRNLFERTADIGFLATDNEIRAFAEAAAGDATAAGVETERSALRRRFAEYVQKYSVYHNIMLFAADGTLLVQLDETNAVTKSRDALIGESLTSAAAYVETARPTDVVPGDDSPLVYSYRVMSADGTRAVGVLCLCFRFQDECERIFGGLVKSDDWNVITLLSPQGRVIASSDIYQFPVGARLAPLADEECRIVRFAGREYLATTCATEGYQGYAGPGWVGHVLSPLNHAFEMAAAHELDEVAPALLEGVLATSTLFSQALREIPLQAARIQNQLNRAVWNGNLWLTRDHYAMNTAFAKVLLWEIGSTGTRTRNVFIDSTTNLYETVVSSVLYDCAAQAALAIDIMDRNLYERANDCRWWALTTAFRAGLTALDAGEEVDRDALTQILRTINGLYTVYSNLVLFDAKGSIVAVSNPLYGDMIGQTLPHDWARQTLALADTASYCVSPFAPSALYGGRPTYIYAAAIKSDGQSDRDPAGRGGTKTVGGIAIVFDSAPQFPAMLRDALPRDEDGAISEGAFAVFAHADGSVIASTEPNIAAGSRLDIAREFFAARASTGCPTIIAFGGRYYAVASRRSVGYREYKSTADAYRNDVVAIVMVPLSASLPAAGAPLPAAIGHENQLARRAGGEDCVEIATFHIDKGWYGVRVEHALETIEQKSITAMPGMPASVRGCIMHGGQALPVLDLAAFLGAPEADRASPASRTSAPQIVLIRVAERQVSYGIIVDRLGEILDVANARIEPIPQMINDGLLLAESLVQPHADDPEQRILVVLSAERLLRRLAGGDRLLGELTDFGASLQRLKAASTPPA